ncbi:MAG: hypothetical protein ACK4UT_00390 [Moraxellaceae bacterium]
MTAQGTRCRPLPRPSLAGMLALLLTASAAAVEWRGDLTAETFLFAAPGAQQQARTNAALAVGGELWHDIDSRQRISASPLLRIDQRDSRRHRIDLQEAYWSLHDGGTQWQAGLRQVFWGVTEGVHLVDIVNQTDQAGALNGEQKLGQPLLGLRHEQGAHSLELYVLTGARERRFAGSHGRLRLPLVVDHAAATYESSRENRRLDTAGRWQYNPGALRLGLSAFSGTAREPELRPAIDMSQVVFAGGVPVAFAPGYTPRLVPHYGLLRQLGVDAQYTQGDLLWKLEAVQRNGGAENHQAAAAGLEYTQVGVADSRADLGWLLEYLHDSRDARATTPFEHDLLLGWRLALNNTGSSELLASVIVDLRTQERLLSLEGRHRLRDDLRLDVEMRLTGHTPPPQTAFDFVFANDGVHKLRPLAADDYLRLALSWFF